MGFKKGDYVRCMASTSLITKGAVYRVTKADAFNTYVEVDENNPSLSYSHNRFIPWEPAPGDWIKQNTTGGEFCLKAHSANSMEDWSVEKNPVHPLIHGVYDIHTHFTPILARAPKQIEEKTELAIGDEVEILPSQHEPFKSGPAFHCDHGRKLKIDIFGSYQGIPCAAFTPGIGWWPKDSLRKINGGSGAVAPATSRRPKCGEIWMTRHGGVQCFAESYEQFETFRERAANRGANTWVDPKTYDDNGKTIDQTFDVLWFIADISGGSATPVMAGSGVTAPSSRTPAAVPVSERKRIGPYANWAPGDLLAWVARNAGKIGGDAVRDCICRKDWRMAEACMEEWQRRVTAHDSKPTPRIPPTYRQITMNEKAFLEPRILG